MGTKRMIERGTRCTSVTTSAGVEAGRRRWVAVPSACYNVHLLPRPDIDSCYVLPAIRIQGQTECSVEPARSILAMSREKSLTGRMDGRPS